MNLSGKTTRSILDFYKLNPIEDLIVIGDDADVRIGYIKVQKDKSSAGHRGVQSIIDEVGTKGFTRLRIGIDSDDTIYKTLKKENGLEGLVLKNFTEEEESTLSSVFNEASEQLINIILKR